MFKDKSKVTPDATDTLIGAGTEMEGQMKSHAGVRVEGTFKGEIDSKGDVVIGAKGVARSNITARDVTIAGKVFGDVSTRGKLIITATGFLEGNMSAAVLVIQEGGKFNGASQMERIDAKSTADSPSGHDQPQQHRKSKQQAG